MRSGVNKIAHACAIVKEFDAERLRSHDLLEAPRKPAVPVIKPVDAGWLNLEHHAAPRVPAGSKRGQEVGS